MSNIELERPRDTKQKRRKIVPLFKSYCIHKFGSETWERFESNSEFYDALLKEPMYGNSIFADLVDMVCDFMNIEIKDLLSDFGEFIRTYFST